MESVKAVEALRALEPEERLDRIIELFNSSEASTLTRKEYEELLQIPELTEAASGLQNGFDEIGPWDCSAVIVDDFEWDWHSWEEEEHITAVLAPERLHEIMDGAEPTAEEISAVRDAIVDHAEVGMNMHLVIFIRA